MQLIIDKFTESKLAERNRTASKTLSNGESLLLLANGSQTGWDIGYQPIIDMVKDTFAVSFSHNAGSVQQRLLQAEVDVELALRERFPFKDEFEDEVCAATFLAAVFWDMEAYLTWIGSEQAKLFRNGRCVHSTQSHVQTFGKVEITSRSLSTHPKRTKEHADLAGPWSLIDGDIVVVADHKLFALGSEEHLASLLSTDSASPAKALVEWAEGVEHRFAQSAIVARVSGN